MGSMLLSQCKFSVFGVGSGAYGATFNAVGRDLSKRMRALGAAEILPVWEGDVDDGDIDQVFEAWSGKLMRFLKGGVAENGLALGNGVGAEGETEYSDVSDDEEGEEEVEEKEEGGFVDLEDIAGKAPSRGTVTVAKTNGTANGKRDMVTPVIRASLEKQVSLFSPTSCQSFLLCFSRLEIVF